MIRHVRTLALAVLLTGSVAGIARAQGMDAKKTLYDRLGGKAAIVAVVDDFVGRVAADKRINAFFAATAGDAKRLAGFKGRLVDQICEASGGPCKYTGKSMKAAHAGMGVKSSDFDALVEDLVGALDKFKVAAADKATLLGVLGPMKGDIVTK
jgi:hemoglobin